MKNPLNKRLPREFRKDFGKYLVIFLLLVITIGFVSGFLVADGSMIKAYNEGIDKYNTENGHFRTSEKMNDAQIQSVEENRIRIYDNFYLEQDLTNGSTMRIFANRDQVNLACLMEGEFPKAANEIAIDRMYADNNKISIGDTLKSDTQSWKVTGLIALPDYSCLFQNNNDSMFDSVKFGIGVVTSEAFESLDSPLVKYCYAWKYNDEPTTEKKEKEVSDDLMKAINKEVSLEEFVPRYLNQAITFTRDDMGSDRAMMIVFLYIVIAIMAFVFGITISNTIAKESNVIGTLLASGYTRNELIRHYMAMPILVTLIGALQNSLSALSAGSLQLTQGLTSFQQGINQLSEGSSTLSQGATKLGTAGKELKEGYTTLAEGISSLSEGLTLFDKEGIQELEKLGGDDLKNLSKRMKAVKEADTEYDNYGGKLEEQTGEVRFIIETDGID